MDVFWKNKFAQFDPTPGDTSVMFCFALPTWLFVYKLLARYADSIAASLKGSPREHDSSREH